MKKEKLIELGISEELAGKVLELHNTAVKELNGQVTTLKADLKTAQDTAKKFEGIDIENVKKTEYERGKKEASGEFEKYKYDRAVEDELKKFGAKNTKAVRALLDMDKVKFNKDGQLEGLSEQLESAKKDNDYLFSTDDGKPSFAGGTGGKGNAAEADATLRAAMGLKAE